MKPDDKIAKVMREFEAGTLRSSSGELVTSKRQAMAIAMSEAGVATGDGWITVHPNGAGTKGVPVLLGPDGTVQGGMGGKFNGQHISNLKGDKSKSAPLTSEQRNDIARSTYMYEKYGGSGEGSRGKFKEAARSGKLDHLYEEYSKQHAETKAASEAAQKAQKEAKSEAWKKKNLPKLAEAKRKREEAAKAERAAKVEAAKRYEAATAPGSVKTYLNVPYHLKEHAKAAGAFWDPDRKKWFVSGDVPSSLKHYVSSAPSSEAPRVVSSAPRSRSLPTYGKIGADDPSVYGSELLGHEGSSWSTFLNTPEGRRLKSRYEKAR